MAGEFGPDGTQALPPLPVYPDALGGLAPAAMTDPLGSSSQSYEDVPDTVVPPPVPPVTVDIEQVRAAARRELARDRARRAAPPVQPAPLPPAPGLQRTRTAPAIGLQAAGGLPPAPAAIQAQRRNSAAGCVGCAVVLLFIALMAVVVVVGMQR
ncbi:hypothetical protein [Kutzneria kofuensis]|uniref:Uncharacterized protein n=1 Tax=Kutzneria kofuensis TaxID=103725 RepID=A0A7W9NH93_9PSEU|nr:hypothetical protein [Kutzneria kofuensis]MBB5892329.1 hypothetical protein [Kutzneria kofuensis]